MVFETTASDDTKNLIKKKSIALAFMSFEKRANFCSSFFHPQLLVALFAVMPERACLNLESGLSPIKIQYVIQNDPLICGQCSQNKKIEVL